MMSFDSIQAEKPLTSDRGLVIKLWCAAINLSIRHSRLNFAPVTKTSSLMLRVIFFQKTHEGLNVTVTRRVVLDFYLYIFYLTFVVHVKTCLEIKLILILKRQDKITVVKLFFKWNFKQAYKSNCAQLYLLLCCFC